MLGVVFQLAILNAALLLVCGSKCLKGSFFDDAIENCVVCGAGLYSSRDGATSCSLCEAGQYSVGPRSSLCESLGNDNCAPEKSPIYYEIHLASLSWYSASNRCKSRSGLLAAIHSTDENTFAASLLTGSSPMKIWIGNVWNLTNNNWTWTDGSPEDFSNFDENLTNSDNSSHPVCATLNSDGDGGLISRKGSWESMDCDSLDVDGYICEYPSGATACEACSTGAYSTALGASSFSSCVLCEAGKFSESSASTDCVFCSAGSFSSTNASLCTICEVGKFSESSASTECISCSDGSFSSTNASVCTSCEDDSGMAAACVSCTPGKYKSAGLCDSCSAGFYSSAEGMLKCSSCPAGTYSSIIGNYEEAACEACYPGTYSGKGAENCTQCWAGSWQSTSGASTCVLCEDGKYSTIRGADDPEMCQGNATSGCRAGEYWSAGTAESNCTPCDAGWYVSAMGLSPCIACEPGSYASAEGSSTCIACESGYYSFQEAATECNACAVGQQSRPWNLKIYDVAQSWGESERACADRGGHLASIESMEESDYLAELIDGLNTYAPVFWIGLSRVSNDSDVWVWSDRSQATFTNWNSWYDPSNLNWSCVGALSRDGVSQLSGLVGSWINFDCSSASFFGYVCEFMGSSGCDSCPNGTYSATLVSNHSGHEASKCLPCAGGSWVVETATECELCPPGTWSTVLGATSNLVCEQCKPGAYSNSSGSVECTECHAGSWQQDLGASNCFLCTQAGMYSDVIGATTSSVCSGSCNVGSKLSESADGCEVCKPGSYSSALSSSACLPCEAGKYSSFNGASICFVCSAGKFAEIKIVRTLNFLLQPNESWYYAENQCKTNQSLLAGDIPKPGSNLFAELMIDTSPGESFWIGYIQPAEIANLIYAASWSSSNYTPDVFDKCVALEFTDNSINLLYLNCYSQNVSGFICEEKVLSAASSCSLCFSGSYSSFAGSSSCIGCSVALGKYSTVMGATSPDACLGGQDETCAAGSYMNLSSCQLCDSGTYTSSTGATACTYCKTGSYPDATNGASSCSRCSAGAYSSSIHVTNSSACLPCGPGTYTSSTGATVCTACRAGSYPDATTGASSCSSCSVGTYSPSFHASYACLPCDSGTYTSSTGATACRSCKPGLYTDITQSSSCSCCNAGTFSSFSGSSACVACDRGKYAKPCSDITGPCCNATTCSPCQQGTYSNITSATSSAACIPCPAGHFATGISLTECRMCKSGTFSTSVGSSSASACKSCPSGKYASDSTICLNCPPGQYQKNTFSKSCQTCKAGTFSTQEGMELCTPCKLGFFSNITGATTQAVCTQCSPGSFSNASGSSVCIMCPPGYYSSPRNDNCTGCPLGTFLNKTGASSISQCMQCPWGKFSAFSGAGCDGCKAGTYFTNKCFFSLPLLVDWSTAQSICIASGGNLTAINTWEENKAVADYIKTNNIYNADGFWIGLTISSDVSDPNLQWSDGSESTYSNWDPYQPLASNGYVFIVLQPTDQVAAWSTDNMQNHSFICQRKCNDNFAQYSQPPVPCSFCQPGTFSDMPGATSYDACMICRAGQYATTVGATICQSCTAGTYASQIGNFDAKNMRFINQCSEIGNNCSSSPCKLTCSNGELSRLYYADNENETWIILPDVGINTMVKLDFTIFDVEDDYDFIFLSSCKDYFCAEFNQETPFTGDTQPTYSNGVRVRFQSDESISGSWSLSWSSDFPDVCNLCSAGSYATSFGASSKSSCVPCSEGMYSSMQGSPECSSCPAGEYSTYSGSKNCSKCVPGTFAVHRNYVLNRSLVTWPVANETCTLLGGNLVSIGSESDNLLIKESLARVDSHEVVNVWIGYRVLGETKGGEITWSDKSKSKYSKFYIESTTPILNYSSQAQSTLNTIIFSTSAPFVTPSQVAGTLFTSTSTTSDLSQSAPSATSSAKPPRPNSWPIVIQNSRSATTSKSRFSAASSPSDFVASNATTSQGYVPFETIASMMITDTWMSYPASAVSTSRKSAMGTSALSTKKHTSPDSSRIRLGSESSTSRYRSSFPSTTPLAAELSICALFSNGEWLKTNCNYNNAFLCMIEDLKYDNISDFGRGATSCTGCVSGKYSDQNAASGCQMCTAGKYSSITKADTSSSCLSCMPGSFSSALGADSNEACLSCHPGTYSDDIGSLFCKLCSIGTYSPVSNASSSLSCIACVPGTYGSFEGSTGCNNCKNGTYSNLTGLTSDDLCQKCLEGKFLSSPGSVSEGACSYCQEGTFSNTSAASMCSSCVAGTFSDENGSTVCIDCSPAFYTPMTGYSTCLSCVAGKYSDLNASTLCTECYSGTFSSQEENSFCSSCDVGTYSSTIGSRFCVSCNSGEYQTGTGMISGENCTNCDSGHFSSGFSMTVCLPCSSGTFSSSSASSNCTLCKPGTYQTGSAMIDENCSVCDAGLYQTGLGMISLDNCTFCKPGTFSSAIQSINCAMCQSGTYQSGQGMTDSTNCSLCDSGSYQTGTGLADSSECIGCSAGTFGTGSGLIGSAECILCSAGTYNTGLGLGLALVDGCTLCGEGKYQSGAGITKSADCKFCLSGTYQSGTGMISSSNCSLCGTGKYQTGSGLEYESQCFLCMEGKFQTGTGMDTELDCIDCIAGKYQTGKQMMSESSCLLCGQGTYQSRVGRTSPTDCSECGSGKYQTGLGMIMEGDCALCPPGTYGTSVRAISNLDCTLCFQDTYSTSSGSDSPLCTPCPNGTTTNGINGSKDISFCECDWLHYTVDSGVRINKKCKPCPPAALCTGSSKYTAGTCLFNENYLCNTKPEGNWTLTAAGIYALTACGAGYSLNQSTQQCTKCLEGYYIVNPNKDECQECPLGGGPSELHAQTCTSSAKFVLGSQWILDQNRYRLVSCPSGYQVAYTRTGGVFNWASQYCEECPAGLECAASNCTVCTTCQAGKYKATQSANLCEACDADTFNPRIGSVSRTDCHSCPCQSTTLGSVGKSRQSDCVCNAQYYKTIANDSNQTAACQTCPKGAVCSYDSSCALARPPSFKCPAAGSRVTYAIGTWKKDSYTGKYFLRDCPAGYTLVSVSRAGSEDLQECKACISPSQYILQPEDDCQTCPPGLMCDGGSVVIPVINGSVWNRNGSIYILISCPLGYQILASNPASQICVACGKGAECTVGPCSVCSACPLGFYKSEVSTSPCQPCPADTYGTLSGGQDENTACTRCPADSGTNNNVGQSSVESCLCISGYYLDTVNTSQAKGQCLVCPAGATCPGGVAPLFGEAITTVLSLATSISEYCCNAATESMVASSLAQSMNIDLSSLFVQSPCTTVQCRNKPKRRSTSIPSAALQSVFLYLVGKKQEPSTAILTIYNDAFIRDQSSSINSIQLQCTAVLSSSKSNFNSSTFPVMFAAISNLSITVISIQSIGSLDSAGQIYGPVDSQGQYHLLGCRTGYILSNESVATQSCIACAVGTYSMDPLDGCSADGVCPQRSVCNLCPAGASCAGLSDFKPIVKDSVWVAVRDPVTRTTIMHLSTCPPGMYLLL